MFNNLKDPLSPKCSSNNNRFFYAFKIKELKLDKAIHNYEWKERVTMENFLPL